MSPGSQPAAEARGSADLPPTRGDIFLAGTEAIRQGAATRVAPVVSEGGVSVYELRAGYYAVPSDRVGVHRADVRSTAHLFDSSTVPGWGTVPPSPPPPSAERIVEKALELLPGQPVDPPAVLRPEDITNAPHAEVPGHGTAYIIFGNLYLQTNQGDWRLLGENVHWA